MQKNTIDILTGPTACGKSKVSQILAERYNLELVSMDSMKIYRGMDIGTGKPSAEIRAKIKYHLIDIVEPRDSYNVGRFVADAEMLIDEAVKKKNRLLFVGGTALYFKGLTEGIFQGPSADWSFRKKLQERAEAEGVAVLYNELCGKDARAASKIQPNDLRRIIRALEVFELTGTPISARQTQFGTRRTDRQFRIIVLWRDRTDLYKRIDERVEKMFQSGLVAEVERLYNSEYGLSREAAQGVGYKEVIAHLKGAVDLDEAKELVKFSTHHLARHQMTWFRKFKDVQNIEVDNLSAEEIADKVAQMLY